MRSWTGTIPNHTRYGKHDPLPVRPAANSGGVARYSSEFFDIMCCSSSLPHRRSKPAQQYANSKQPTHPSPRSLAHRFRFVSTRPRRALLRAQVLRHTAQSSPIPPSHFATLTDHLTHAFTKGDYLKIDPSKPVERDEEGNRVAPPAMSSLTDPAMMEGMMGGMKNQFVTMVPQMLIMGWVNFFFSGFVLSALPHSFASQIYALVI
jgi:hypothetical protein